jgi:alpha-1,2-mannosyltransferase
MTVGAPVAVRLPMAVLVGMVLVEALLVGTAVRAGGAHGQLRVLGWEATAFGVFLIAIVLLRQAAASPWLILGGGALLQLAALTAAPATSDDDHRYIWDAKVQLAGIDPYRYPPVAPELARLRDGFLFPATHPCPGLLVDDGTCVRMNHPTVHTIYPPVAQAVFVLVRLASFGGHGGSLPLQIAAAAGALAITALLLRRATRAGRPLWPVALWAWCPITAIELGNNGHIDWAAVLVGLLALEATRRRADGLSGALLGAGIAIKLYPGLLLAPLARRRPVVTIGAAAAVVAVCYLPHVLAVGTGVLGYLPDYLRADGYDSGGRYRLLALLVPSSLVTPAAMLVLLGALAWGWSRGRDPVSSVLVVVGVAVLVATPSFPWYVLLLLALAAAAERPEWLGVVAAPALIYLAVASGAPGELTSTASYAVAAGILLAGLLVRRTRAVGP